MGIYINVGHVREDGGRPWKHRRGDCPLLRERALQGFPSKYTRNSDRKFGDDTSKHQRERCPVCFSDQEELARIPDPSWLREARALEREKAGGTAWTYDLMWPQGKMTQIGHGTNLYDRLASRWRATCAGSKAEADPIPWLHDLIIQGRQEEVVLVATSFPSKEAAHTAERRLRDEKRSQGWDVSSMV